MGDNTECVEIQHQGCCLLAALCWGSDANRTVAITYGAAKLTIAARTMNPSHVGVQKWSALVLEQLGAIGTLEDGLVRTQTLSVEAYPGEDITMMYHGTDSRSAQIIACGQLFKPSCGGLLGDGMYMTRTRQKAEGYRIHHPNSGSTGGRARNLPLLSGHSDPGCILQFRVLLGACKVFEKGDRSGLGK